MQYVAITSGTGVKPITNTRNQLRGWAINCTVTGVIKIRDGAAGQAVVTLNMANGTQNVEGGLELPFNENITVEVVSGNFEGTVWVG